MSDTNLLVVYIGEATLLNERTLNTAILGNCLNISYINPDNQKEPLHRNNKTPTQNKPYSMYYSTSNRYSNIGQVQYQVRTNQSRITVLK